MNTAEPKIIYLQIGEDADISEFKKEDFETNAITWCWERIFKNDIEYISKQSIIGLIDKKLRQNDQVINAFKDIEGVYALVHCEGYKIALTELKQKIEQLYKGE